MMVFSRSNQIRKRKEDATKSEEEVLFENPEDVEQISTIAQSQKPHKIRLAQKLFGPPQWTLKWNQRRYLFQQLGSLENLTTLIVHGTIMGQVIPGHSLALSISAPNLRVLKVEGGIILDSITYVVDMAEAVQNHKSLEEFSFLNFLNHITPVDSLYLLDPLLGALCTVPNLKTLQLRCFSSFMHWDSSFASSPLLTRLLTSMIHLKHLELTNLGLGDDNMQVITANARPQLRELVLNANNNTKTGLNFVLGGIQPTWTKLEVANDVKLNKESFGIVYEHLSSYTSSLQHFLCTYPLGMQESKRSIDLQLKLHRMNLNRRYYSPAVTPEQRVHLLSEVAATTKELDFIYTLLREQPMICDLEMNGIDHRRSKDMRMHQMTLLLILCLLWTQYLIGGFRIAMIETEFPSLEAPDSTSTFAPGVFQIETEMSRLESARSKRNDMRSRVQMKINALAKATPTKRSIEEKHTGNQRSLKLQRLQMQSQRNSLQSAMTCFCSGSERISTIDQCEPIHHIDPETNI